MPEFVHYDLEMMEPSFDSSLTDLIIHLDKLRDKRLSGSTNPEVFFQLKHIFHLLESLGSARIEGNNTTLAEYIETKIETREKVPQSITEIKNIEDGMRFVEENIKDHPINNAFIRELHKLVVKDLVSPPNGEGDNTPGEYRRENIKIGKSDHLPPDFLKVNDYMDELIRFIGTSNASKYDLLKIAISHHRFAWIHPFKNGNGRTVRLLTYAMLVKAGFNVNQGRILNPTAIFCNNRDEYYNHLSFADSGKKEGILKWCEYVLKGLGEEIAKIDKLLDYDYLKKEILLPTISYSLDRKFITVIEAKVLETVIEKQVIKANDIKATFNNRDNAIISREIKKLIEKKMLSPLTVNGRKYSLRFDNNYLIRGVMKILSDKGFVSLSNI